MEINRRVVMADEENLIIMHRYVSGFSLETREWGMSLCVEYAKMVFNTFATGTFYVEHLHPVETDQTVFDKVVLDPAKKDIIKTLVESHKDRVSHYDDLIRGKG